jgi:hypothetical protein
VLEEQYYTLYRDLRSWTAALTLRLRDNRQATGRLGDRLDASSSRLSHASAWAAIPTVPTGCSVTDH